MVRLETESKGTRPICQRQIVMSKNRAAQCMATSYPPGEPACCHKDYCKVQCAVHALCACLLKPASKVAVNSNSPLHLDYWTDVFVKCQLHSWKPCGLHVQPCLSFTAGPRFCHWHSIARLSITHLEQNRQNRGRRSGHGLHSYIVWGTYWSIA